MRRVLVLASLLLLQPVLASAALFVCGDPTRFVGHTFTERTQPPTGCPAPYLLSDVPEADTDAQLALITSQPKKYLKVVDGLVVDKTQAEKDAVDAAAAAEEQERQAYEEAATNNDLCNATLDQLDAAKTTLQNNLQGDIAGITNIDTAKTELTDMMGRLVNALEKLMRCIRGRAGPPPPAP